MPRGHGHGGMHKAAQNCRRTATTGAVSPFVPCMAATVWPARCGRRSRMKGRRSRRPAQHPRGVSRSATRWVAGIRLARPAGSRAKKVAAIRLYHGVAASSPAEAGAERYHKARHLRRVPVLRLAMMASTRTRAAMSAAPALSGSTRMGMSPASAYQPRPAYSAPHVLDAHAAVEDGLGENDHAPHSRGVRSRS